MRSTGFIEFYWTIFQLWVCDVGEYFLFQEEFDLRKIVHKNAMIYNQLFTITKKVNIFLFNQTSYSWITAKKYAKYFVIVCHINQDLILSVYNLVVKFFPLGFFHHLFALSWLIYNNYDLNCMLHAEYTEKLLTTWFTK